MSQNNAKIMERKLFFFLWTEFIFTFAENIFSLGPAGKKSNPADIYRILIQSIYNCRYVTEK